jgi:hypothetical protein
MDNKNEVVNNNDQNEGVDKKEKPVNLGRHQAQCTICRFEFRREIEELFIDWMSPDVIESKFKFYNISRDSVYRHAKALDFFSKRRKNYIAALEKIIQRVDTTPVTCSGIISAFKVLAKMEDEKQAREDADPKKLFDRMSPAEREAFARDGTLPEWFSGEKAATSDASQQVEEKPQTTESERLQ